MWYIHIAEYYSTLKKEGNLDTYYKWMDLYATWNKPDTKEEIV